MAQTIPASAVTPTATPCPRLNGQCVGDLPGHEHHWGADYELPAPRPSLPQAALVNLVDFGQGPRVNVSLGLDADLTLPELDQLIAGIEDLKRQLKVAAAHLAAAERLHEVTR